MTNNKKQRFDPKHAFIATVPRLLLITVSSGLLLLFISALLVYGCDRPLTLVGPIAAACLYIASFISGFASGRLTDKPISYASAAMSSAIIIIVTVSLSLLFPRFSGEIDHTASFFMRVSILPVALIGTLVSERAFRSKRKRVYRPRRKR